MIQTERPNKKIFSITETGKKAFMNWLLEGAGPEATHFKNSFLMKVFFGGNMAPAQSADMLRKFKTECEAYLKHMETTPESIEKYGYDMDTYQTIYWQFTVDYGYGFIRNSIEWAKRCIQKLQSINEQSSKED